MTYAKEEPAGFAVLTRDSPTAAARRGLTRVIDDLAQRVGDIFHSEFERAGYNSKVAPIYANALVGMVTQVGQWWAAEGRALLPRPRGAPCRGAGLDGTEAPAQGPGLPWGPAGGQAPKLKTNDSGRFCAPGTPYVQRKVLPQAVGPTPGRTPISGLRMESS